MKKCSVCGGKALFGMAMCQKCIDEVDKKFKEEEKLRAEKRLVEETTANDLIGVKGWLKFFVVLVVYIRPIFVAIMLILSWIGAKEINASYPGYSLYVFAISIVEGSLAIWGIGVGIALSDINVLGVQKAQRWLIAGFVWFFVSRIIAYMLGITDGEMDPKSLRDMVISIIWFAVWYRYFNVSARVKATYLAENKK